LPSSRTKTTKHDRASGQLLHDLASRSRVRVWEATKAINNQQALKPALLRLLSRGKTYTNRAAAATALATIKGADVTEALENVVTNRSEKPVVRGHAAEALVHRLRARSVRILIDCLGDRAAEVRFWAAFALGEGRRPEALKALRALLKDDRIVPGWGPVRKEARWAIRTIRHKER